MVYILKRNFSVSVLNSKNIPNTLKKIGEYVKKYKLKEDLYDTWVHFDVMDGKFVPNTGIDLKYIKTAKNIGLYADVHLMVQNPLGEKFVNTAIENGADNITIHYEIENFEAVLERLNKIKEELLENYNRKLKIGVSIKPKTDINEIIKYKNKFDILLLMSVEPGFGGQEYIKSTNSKIEDAKRIFNDKIIQIDGGINFDTYETLCDSFVDSFVVGSYITKTDEVEKRLMSLNILNKIVHLPKDANKEFDMKLLQIVPGGYGKNDVYMGISLPTLRKFANSWYKRIDAFTLQPFIISKYHDFRRFALICMSNMVKYIASKDESDDLKEGKILSIVNFMNEYIEYINNWDLTDLVAPDVLGRYLLVINDKKKARVLAKYIDDENIWIKRIGIVSMLTLARNDKLDICLNTLEKNIYHEHHLIQKATGWVLRELYKKHPMEIVKFLQSKNIEKKLPSFVLSYACEKMSKREKEMVKDIK